MALVLIDRAQETATANTTVSFTLLGASTGYQTLAAVGDTNTTYYGATDGTNWEVGIGTYSTTGPTLTRTTILSSSNAGAAVTFSGTVTVFVDYPSEKSVYRDGNGNTSVNNFIAGFTNVTSAGGTTVLTASSTQWQFISGTANQTFTLPDATTLIPGATFIFDNDSTGTVTINNSASTLVDSIPSGGVDLVLLENNSTSAGSWGKYSWIPSSINWGTSSVDFNGTGINNAVIGDITPNAGTFTTVTSTFSPTNTVPAVSLIGTPNSATGGKVGVLAIGPDFSASDKNLLATFVQDINDYTQIIVQNQNVGTSASADFVVNNDSTTGAGTYGDFGINSSNFSGTGSFNLANATYLYSQGGELVIGTQGSNGIRFVTNASTTDAGGFSNTGAFSLGTPLALTSGGTGATTAPQAYNNLFGYSATSTAGGTTTLTNASSIYQQFTGTQVQTVRLPSTATLTLGSGFHIANSSTGVLTLQTSTAVALTTIAPGATVMATSVSTSVDTAAGWELGFTDFSVDSRQVPQNAQTGNYTLTTTDYGKHIYHAAAAAAATYTIPANASVPFEIGTTITFVNMSTNNVTIAITTDTMYLAGTGTTGSRTLAQYGMATALKMTATTWIISGSALT